MQRTRDGQGGSPVGIDADYLVVGAGATGMAFTDSLIDHCDARVVLTDRRPAPGGHWLDAYPFVRLHQASAFYGVASTLLGEGRRQVDGPEAGLHERANREQICAYYETVLNDRFLPSGQVEFLASSDYDWDRRVLASGGTEFVVGEQCRIVDARFIAPEIPATTPPPFEATGGARVVPVNDLPRVEDAPSQYVIVGSGKTATDAVVWLLGEGVAPDAICWVRPREPWMLNRAKVQPSPEVFLGMAADTLQAAEVARSVDDLFARLEELGIMLRIDRTRTPTMARTPTLATWELELLRSIENVVRLGRLRRAEPGRLIFDDGSAEVSHDALIVHCAVHAFREGSAMPIWGNDAIRTQSTRAGFPCFGAALIGYVEATREGDAVKNTVCPSSPSANTLTDWLAMNVLGTRSAMAFGAESDIDAWAHGVALNPARIPAGYSSPELEHVRTRLASHTASGLAAMTRLWAASR
ncbi:NAD(P)-binding protein [Ruania alba]|uniref:NAD(P)-binding protein n=1 Tax=Ruania alba TaxID=648782 RepID=UPI001FE1C242|nr:NAD(P)-binding protein [Ruania alba]